MFHDENHPPIDFASLPRIHVKRHFKRQSPLTIEDLNRLVRVVKPLSERFPSCRKNPGRYEGPAQDSNEQLLSHDSNEQLLSHDSNEQLLSHDSNEQLLSHDSNEQLLSHDSNEQLLSHPSLCVTLAVVNDEVCRVQVKEAWRENGDVWHNEKFDISRKILVGKQAVGNLRNVIVGSRSQRYGSDSTNVVRLEELTSVEMSSDMSLCSDDDVVDTSIMVAPRRVPFCAGQAIRGSILESENMEKLGKRRQETLEEDLVEQSRSEAEFGALMTTTREEQLLNDLTTYHRNVSWQCPGISETMVQNFDSMNCNSNSVSNGMAPNLGHSVQYSWASVGNYQGMESMDHVVVDTDQRNTDKDDLANGGLKSQKQNTPSVHQPSDVPESGNRDRSFNQPEELERLKTRRQKDESRRHRKHRSDDKEQVELGDEDLLNEGLMELEKALFKRRAERDPDKKKHRKLENARLFHGRTILAGKCAPLLIPLEDVSNEKHYKWKDGQLVSYMTDPRLEKSTSQKKDNPAQCDLIQVSFAKSPWDKMFIKTELNVDDYESSETLNRPTSNVPHGIGNIQDQFTANEHLPVRADGNTLGYVDNACPIPVVLSQSFFSYVERVSVDASDHTELDQTVLPPDWMDEPSPETLRRRSSCCYVNEMLRNISKCIMDARVISDNVYRDTMLVESLQCIQLALDIHSNL